MNRLKRVAAAIIVLCLAVSLIPTASIAATNITINSTNFADDNFRQYVSDIFDENGDGYLSQSEINAVSSIDITELNIASLRGISFFTELVSLKASYNALTVLDLSGNTKLISMDCSYNQIKGLDLSGNTALTTLVCNDNKLETLDISGCTKLTSLNCANNLLDSINLSNNTKLLKLECNNNRIATLDVGSNTLLKKLICNDNMLMGLDLDNNRDITEFKGDQSASIAAQQHGDGFALYMQSYVSDTGKISPKTTCDYDSSSGIVYFPELPSKWAYTYATGQEGKSISVNVSFSNKFTVTASAGKNGTISPSGESTCDFGDSVTYSFLPNAGYSVGKVLIDGEEIGLCLSYTFENIRRDHTVSVEFISSTAGVAVITGNFPDTRFRLMVTEEFDLDRSGYLSPGEIARVKEIDVSATIVKSLKGIEYFTELESLNFGTTLISSVDLSRNIKLKNITCSLTKLESLDLSHNTQIETVNCDTAKLKSINLKGCTNLVSLSCNVNSLTSLDVSSCEKLQTLWCNNNQLTSIDISNNKELADFDCTNNKLTSFDISKNTKLKQLRCSGNLLTKLNLNCCPSLETLYCFSCGLTELEITNCASLKNLSCGYNQLTRLSIDGAENLDVLSCEYNRLTTLNFAAITHLKELNCASNNLTSLDVSKNTELEELNCSNNCLAEINLDNNSRLSKPTLGEQNLTGLMEKMSEGWRWRYDISGLVSDLSRVSLKKKTDENVDYNKRTGIVMFAEHPGSWTYVWDSGRKDMDVKITFTNKFSITASCGEHGKITPEGTTEVSYGASQAYVFTPDIGYHVSKVFVDGKSVTPSGMYTMMNIKDDHTLYAEFEIDTYMITALSNEGGTITPAGISLVKYGESVTYTVTANNGCYIKSVKINGITQLDVPKDVYTHTFSNLLADQTITVEFVTNTVEIKSSAGYGGVISPYGTSTVDYDGSIIYTVTPQAGYTLFDVKVDGESVGPVESYTFSNLTKGHEIKAYFAKAFEDVDPNGYYYRAVLWASCESVVTGTSETEFSPDENCLRCQVVTLLWRAFGSPAPKIETVPFTDMKGEFSYSYKAIRWAYENGITNGTTETTFSPADTVTRGQFVTFLWRTMGEPESTADNPFTDLDEAEYYYKAVLWAYKKGITTGTSATEFSPEETCTRAQVVTFLYRALYK